jgi:hypothetical protein
MLSGVMSASTKSGRFVGNLCFYFCLGLNVKSPPAITFELPTILTGTSIVISFSSRFGRSQGEDFVRTG